MSKKVGLLPASSWSNKRPIAGICEKTHLRYSSDTVWPVAPSLRSLSVIMWLFRREKPAPLVRWWGGRLSYRGGRQQPPASTRRRRKQNKCQGTFTTALARFCLAGAVVPQEANSSTKSDGSFGFAGELQSVQYESVFFGFVLHRLT